jgi:hypothetical protein
MNVQPDQIGQRLLLQWGTGEDRAEGKMIAHSLAPMVLIETDTGERIWWRQDMAEGMEG